METRQWSGSLRAPAGTGPEARMRAIVQDAFGEEDDVLRLAEIDRPAIGADEVLLRVRTAGVDQGVWHLMAGLPYPVRLAGYGLRAPRNRVPGREVAGTVEVVGSHVTSLRPGDEVFGVADGAFAEYAAARADRLVSKPANLSFAAAATTDSALTALQAVRDHGRVRTGQTVLVIGASGGVGTFAVQIAKAYGAHVAGVCHTTKIDLVQSLGVDDVIDYTRADITDDARRYDVVIDTGGNRSITRLRHTLTSEGTLVLVGQETGGRLLGGLDRPLRAMLLSPFVHQQLRAFVMSENSDDLKTLADLCASGKVRPAVDRTFPLRRAAEAIRYLRDGRARGKVVVTVDSEPEGDPR